MKIVVVVVHFGDVGDTGECLGALGRQDYGDYEVVLVDNGTGDSGLAGSKRVHLMRNGENLGFAEGNNVGIREALKRGADGVLLLNNDAVAAPDLLSRFAKACELYPQAGAFGAKIYFYDEPTVIWHAGGEVNGKTLRCYHRGCGETDLERKWDEVAEIGYACGCALFVRRGTIEKVGLMDGRFFLLWEEIDWCWRMRKAGLALLYIPEARVWHKISRAFEGGNRGPSWQYYYFRNRLLFIEKNLPWNKRLAFYLTVFLKEGGQILLKASHSKLHLSALKGMRDYLLRRFF
jgi:GT2 family glycosyltransferase